MKGWIVAFGLCAALGSTAAGAADAQSDPLSWLGRIASAGQRLTYSGTFTYQSGRNFETSRIAHMADASGEYERLEVLDGSPREVIRNNQEVRCVLPDQKTVIIDRPGSRRAFPARVPAAFSALAESYRIRKGEVGRVAGLDAQMIVLEPRDDLRYGYQMWAELKSGLLLKAKLVDERGEIIEQFAFSDVKIGGQLDSEALKPRFADNAEFRTVKAHGVEVRKEDSAWNVVMPLSGFSLMSMVQRPLGRERGEALHMVFSDGLASISVFIEPLPASGPQPTLGPLSSGAINIFKRKVDGHLVTALGEVPTRAVQRLAESIEPAAR